MSNVEKRPVYWNGLEVGVASNLSAAIGVINDRLGLDIDQNQPGRDIRGIVESARGYWISGGDSPDGSTPYDGKVQTVVGVP